MAKLFIQGVGCYVPHPGNDKMLVLFPNLDPADVKGLENLGHEICKHYAVVQMDSRSLGLPGPNLWTTLAVRKHWIGVDPGGAGGMKDVQEKLSAQLPAMAAALNAANHGGYSPLRNDVIPGSPVAHQRLEGGLFLQQGTIRAASGYEGRIEFKWSDGSKLPADLEMEAASGVVEVDFGEVASFALRLRPFGGATSSIPLKPDAHGKLKVWVRHFCDLDRPEPPTQQSTAEPDGDFLLTYALRRNLTGLLNATKVSNPVNGKRRVPIPFSKSFLRGGKPRQCMGALESATGFEDPFE